MRVAVPAVLFAAALVWAGVNRGVDVYVDEIEHPDTDIPKDADEKTEWAFARRRGDPLDGAFIYAVHERMFDRTWKWAGTPRRSEKNIGVPWTEITVHLRQMLGDVRAQLEYRSYSPTETVARYHHRLVAIHIFSNGNGRHARLMADLLLTDLVGQRFEWGRGSLVAIGDLRARYIAALRAADARDYGPLLTFLQQSAA